MKKTALFYSFLLLGVTNLYSQEARTIILHKNGSIRGTDSLVAWIGNKEWVMILKGDSAVKEIFLDSNQTSTPFTLFIKDKTEVYWCPLNWQRCVTGYVFGIVDDFNLLKEKYSKRDRKYWSKAERQSTMAYSVVIGNSGVDIFKPPKKRFRKLIYASPLKWDCGSMNPAYHYHWMK